MTARLRFIITPRAAKHIREAAAWWDANRPKAPTALDNDLDKAIELITRQPDAGGEARNVRVPGVRRVYLGTTQYYLYYRLDRSSSTILVLALWHTSRGLGPRM